MIAIIGNPNVGKTTFLRKLKEYGYSTYETDAWVLEQYNNEQSEVFKKMIDEFGESIVNDKKINKNALKKLISEDFDILKKIELIVHPFIKQHLEENKYDFVEIPILKWSPVNFIDLFDMVFNLKGLTPKNKISNVDNFSDTLIDTNKRGFRTFDTVDIYAKNTQNIAEFLKKYGIAPR
ncbi:dephospho-CoA kinase [Mycoplasma todarodis]|uniref:dephospho-CoA kinase n=1 Tax=Mycoplasma todarodis TaxID=1937191 RepID=UPI003B352BC5